MPDPLPLASPDLHCVGCWLWTTLLSWIGPAFKSPPRFMFWIVLLIFSAQIFKWTEYISYLDKMKPLLHQGYVEANASITLLVVDENSCCLGTHGVGSYHDLDHSDKQIIWSHFVPRCALLYTGWPVGFVHNIRLQFSLIIL